jgi:hypothetical protein
MKRAIKTLSVAVLLALIVIVIAISWLIPNYAVKINSEITNFFLTRPLL